MSAFGYLRKNGIKHTLEVIWQYKIDRLLLRLLRPICLRLPLTDTIVIESHNDFDSNGGAFYDYLIEHGYNERYRIVWQIKNKASKKVPLPKNVTCVPLWRPSLRKDRIILRAKFFTADEDISGKVRPGQRSYYLTHGTFSLKNAAGLVDIPGSVDYILLGSENVREIETGQFRPQPSTQFLCIGFPLHDRLLMPAVPQLDKVRPGAHFSRTVIWMPTFRTGIAHGRCDSTAAQPMGVPLLEDEHDLDRLDAQLRADDTLLIVKLHPKQDLHGVRISDRPNILLLTGASVKQYGIDTYELLKQTDALISDYSSVAYDYLLLDRPIGYVFSDLADYKLGLVTDRPEELIAGPVIRTFDEFLHFLHTVREGTDPDRERRHALAEKIFTYRDGGACARLVAHMGLILPEKDDQ